MDQETKTQFSYNTIIITGDYENIDIDTLCACEAYSVFLNMRGIQALHIQNPNLTQLQETVFNMCGIELPSSQYIIKFNNKEFYGLIAIKPNSLKTLHPLATPQNTIGMISTFKPEYIDYLSEEDFKNYNTLQFEPVGSVSTLICEKFKLTNTPLSSNIASLLMIGIILNTNGLEEEQTHNRDFVAVQYLEQFANIRKDQINALVNQL